MLKHSLWPICSHFLWYPTPYCLHGSHFIRHSVGHFVMHFSVGFYFKKKPLIPLWILQHCRDSVPASYWCSIWCIFTKLSPKNIMLVKQPYLKKIMLVKQPCLFVWCIPIIQTKVDYGLVLFHCYYKSFTFNPARPSRARLQAYPALSTVSAHLHQMKAQHGIRNINRRPQRSVKSATYPCVCTLKCLCAFRLHRLAQNAARCHFAPITMTSSLNSAFTMTSSNNFNVARSHNLVVAFLRSGIRPLNFRIEKFGKNLSENPAIVCPWSCANTYDKLVQRSWWNRFSILTWSGTPPRGKRINVHMAIPGPRAGQLGRWRRWFVSVGSYWNRADKATPSTTLVSMAHRHLEREGKIQGVAERSETPPGACGTGFKQAKFCTQAHAGGQRFLFFFSGTEPGYFDEFVSALILSCVRPPCW